MITRVLASFAIAAVVALMASLPVAGQSASGSAPPLVITAYNGGPPTNYVTPRTPWGEPDLQGTWSSDDTEGIPRERPPALGTQLYQSDQEYAARAKQVEANVANRENNATSTFRNDFARRAFRQTSIIVDPPDGRMVFQTLYVLVDLYWVGRLGTTAVAAVGISGNLTFIVLAATQMLGVGTTTLVAHATGRRDQSRAIVVFNQAQVLSLVVGIIFLAVALVLRDAYARAFSADEATMALTREYLLWFIPAMALQFGLIAMQRT